ncbi:protein ARABIDILLO 1 [Silene latifolia]|uniref:protein ARABIDILLO 1 n=1 Tax=Silene latifolia TaxID=37657 RepID=UPI003D77876C
MSRRVRRKISKKDKNTLLLPDIFSSTTVSSAATTTVNSAVTAAFDGDEVDWTKLPDDTVIHLFSLLNYRDRAHLSSTCHTWRHLSTSTCLWSTLDLRPHKFDSAAAVSLSSRCSSLTRLRFRGAESADAVILLRAAKLREISADYCRKISDATLSVIAARHEELEILVLGPDFCERVSSDAIRAVGMCCPRLRSLRLSGVREIDSEAINSLGSNCDGLIDVGFMDCLKIDEVRLGNVCSLRFLSVAGTSNLKWDLVSHWWSKLPCLVGLDVSRTDIGPSAVSRLLSCCRSLRVLCVMNCTVVEQDAGFVTSYGNGGCFSKGKLLISLFSNVFKGVAKLFVDNSMEGRNAFLEWRCCEKKNRNLEEIMSWLEWILSHSLLRIAESNSPGLDHFWVSQGATLLLSLLQSSQEDVQERAATGLATFVVIDDESASIDGQRAEAVMHAGGVQLLLRLASSWREGLQAESAKAIANLSVNANVAKAVADEGGITILANLARSMNRLVAEEAAGGLWNLSVGEEHKGAIAEAGSVKALVDLIFKWSSSGDGVLERAAGALANLAADDKCSMEVALAGGVHALVMLARNCKLEGVQEQAARALANLAAHGDTNTNNSAVGQEPGALEALVRLTYSTHEGVRQEAAGALWNLSFDDRNREAMALAGGVEALVALAQSCTNASPGLQERAAGALWGLSVSEANSIAIGREGGVAPLIALACSEAEDVHETAAGALWNLAFNPGNALRIVEGDGVPALVHLSSTSVSKMARFMAALALAYMFDGRIDEVVGSSSESTSKCISLNGARRLALRHIEAFVLTFSDPQAFAAASSSSVPAALTQITEAARIQEAGHLRCSGAEIGRFVAMLRNHSPILKACAAFALLQFTIPGGRHALHHANLLQNAGAARVLRAAAAAATAPLEAKIFARIVLRNLEHHKIEVSL